MSNIAIVTGASRGIGKAIASKLIQDGFFVIGTATSSTGTASIEAYMGDKGIAQVVDVSNQDSIAAFLAFIKEQKYIPQVLVNNAGITQDNLILRMKAQQWGQVIDTNLNGLFYLTQPLLRYLLKTPNARIVNISSVVASTGNPGQANYCASKGAIESMCRSIARELGSRDITVNCVAPGFIMSDMTNELPDTIKENILQQIPLGKMGLPEDIANTVSFLVSENAKYITGQTIHVNGGMFMQ